MNIISKLKNLIMLHTFKINKSCVYCKHSKQFKGPMYWCNYNHFPVVNTGHCWLYKDKDKELTNSNSLRRG